MKHINQRKLFWLFRQLTKSELIILLNYLLAMSDTTDHYTMSVMALTRLLCRNYKTFLNVVKQTKPECLRFITNGILWVKHEIEYELLKRSEKNV